MLRKLAKWITDNFGLKILAVAFALVLWLVVVNVEDPDKTKAYTVPVSIENSEYLSNMGKTYEVLNNTDKISFTVTGKRSVIEELSESDFTASADFENVNEDLSMVPITITVARYKNQIEVSKKSTSMEISVENLITEKFTIETITEGTPADGCYVNKIYTSPQKVTVTGPESVVSQIQTAQVSVSVEGAEESIATNGSIILLDDQGRGVSQERLTLNRTKAAVDVAIMMGKAVSLNFTTTGEPAEGYQCGEVSGSVSEVRLVGAPEILDNLETLDIASPQLALDDVSRSFEVTIDLKNYLPEGASLAEGEASSVTVRVEIVGQETQEFAVPVANIQVENLPDNMELEFEQETVTVTLRGFQEDLEKIAASDLTGIVDASAVTADTKAVVVKLQGDYTAASVIRASVTVTAKEEEPAEDDSDAADTPTEGSTGDTTDGEGNTDAPEETQ